MTGVASANREFAGLTGVLVGPDYDMVEFLHRSVTDQRTGSAVAGVARALFGGQPAPDAVPAPGG
ncbi:hypothetical protein ACFYNO_25635 [Kitasatospora sp. NPDC006697]|uniref:hypothetical protein n=1 Tax=Kitasatospora sp. NPDC006697 TaxID=3364020 RepID=UPI0036A96A0E